MMDIILAAANSAVPLVLASLGGLLSERAGVLNISMEGCITAGAFTTALVMAGGGNPLVAAVAAIAAGAFFGSLLSGFHLLLAANLFIAGMGINLLIPSFAGLISQIVQGSKGAIHIPEAAKFMERGLPYITWLMIPLAILTTLLLKRSRLGSHIRAADSSPDFLRERGISVEKTHFLVLVISSASAALAGAFLALRVGAYVPGMSSGRGWIALVIIWMGFRKPTGILISSYFFTLIEIVAGRFQGIGNVPVTLFLAMPSLAALTALTVATIAYSSKARLRR